MGQDRTSLVVQWLRPANAGDRGSIPGPGGSHVPRRNSLCSTTNELGVLEFVLRNERSHTLQLEHSPYSLPLGKAHTQQRRPSTAKNKTSKILKMGQDGIFTPSGLPLPP